MLPSFCKDTICRLRPQMIERRGKLVPDWNAPTSDELIHGCSMQPASTSLSTDGRVSGITDLYTLFAPTCADIQAGDRIEFNDLIYEVAGDVRIQPTASRLDHLEVSLRRYHG